MGSIILSTAERWFSLEHQCSSSCHLLPQCLWQAMQQLQQGKNSVDLCMTQSMSHNVPPPMRRIAALPMSRSAAPATARSAPLSTPITEYSRECSTNYEQQCSTEYAQECRTNYEQT